MPEAERTRCEVWSRVMGYHRPVINYNPGKRSEFYSRKAFKEKATLNSSFIERYAVEPQGGNGV